MGSERIILCGGVKPAGGGKTASDVLALDLWGLGAKKNVTLRIEDIHQRLGCNVPPAFHDLVEIATYVYAADQATGRGGKDVDTFGEKWRRSFVFHVPVRLPDLWNLPEVKRILCGTLSFLSDDDYEFSFYPATDAPPFQMYLALGDGEASRGEVEQVMLFSGGLDSLSGGIEESIVQKRRALWVSHRPTNKHNRRHREIGQLMAEKAGPLRPAQVLVDVFKDSAMSHEPSQRCRSFLFASLGATVARMVGLNSVRFYENGVVSLNLPVCEQLIGARATRTTHPRVLKGFEALMTHLAGSPFKVENPFLWETKGEVIQRIVKAGCGTMITPSISCAHTWEASLKFPHCGTCSQCIDRRFGIIAAKAEEFDLSANYKLDIFREARPKDADKIMGAAYLERANELQNIADGQQLLARYPEVADVLPYLDLPKASGAAKILDLYKHHANEVSEASRVMLARHGGDIFARRLPGDCLLRTMYESRGLPPAPVEGESGDSEGRKDAAESSARYLFQNAGSHWDVIFDGAKRFTIPDTLGAKYIDYLLHNPNQPIRAFDLEVRIQADKEAARSENTKQQLADGETQRDFHRQLTELRSDRAKALEDDNEAAVKRLAGEIRVVEATLGGAAGEFGDTGERARNNVRKAIDAVVRRLRKRSKHEKAFATHIGLCIKPGYDLMYVQPQGALWQ